MLPNPAFVNQPKEFWANVRTLSQEIGYVERMRRQPGVQGLTGPIKIPNLAEIEDALERLGLTAKHLIGPKARPTALGKRVVAYFAYRAEVLNDFVQARLMNGDQARALFGELQKR